VTYNGRVYTIDAAGIIAVTDDADAPTITYNGNVYTTLKDFADATGFSHAALRQALSRARRQGKPAITYKGIDIHIAPDGSITVNN
jgi:sulfur transfer protein SufE